MTRSKSAGLALLGCLALAAPARAQQPDVALVYRLLQDGQMVVVPAQGAERRAQLGERLRSGDLVATSANTRAALRFTDDGSVLRVNPNARVRLSSGDERGVVVRTLALEFGELWARVDRHQGTTLRVQTPAGVAAVKGTQFVVRVDAQGVTTVLTLEGVVEFFNQAGRVDVAAGQKVVADSAGEAPRAETASAEELRGAEGVRGGEGDAVQGTGIEILVRNASGQTRTVILRVPSAALRELEGRP